MGGRHPRKRPPPHRGASGRSPFTLAERFIPSAVGPAFTELVSQTFCFQGPDSQPC